MNDFFRLYSCECVSKQEKSSKEYINVEIISSTQSYVISFQGTEVVTTTPIQTLQNIIYENTVFEANVMPLHAGAIEKNGAAFIFVAPTGSGKTTLVAYLSNEGYSYIDDDKTIIDMSTLRVLPNHSPIHLRTESLSILNSYGCNVKGKELCVEKIRRIVYTPKAIALSEVPIGGLFFITRSECTNNCESIATSEAVQMIMSSLLQYSSNSLETLKCAIKLAKNCKKLTFSDPRYVVKQINKESTLHE
jgi:hypothetical protein